MAGRFVGPRGGSDGDDMSPEDAPVRTSKPAEPEPRARPPVVVAVTPEPAVRSSHRISTPVPVQREAALPRPAAHEGELEIVPPQWRPSSAYRPATVTAIDAPVAQDLFGEGGYEELDGLAPPSEEAPAQVMEDVGQPYTTPYTVPEPPPIPGILDRFTPSPAQRTEIGSRRKKPDYLADDGPKVKDFRPTPAPSRREERTRQAPAAQASITVVRRPAEEPQGGNRGAVLGVLGILFGLLGLGALIAAGVVLWIAKTTPAADEEPTAIPTTDVEVRDRMGDRDPNELPPVQDLPTPSEVAPADGEDLEAPPLPAAPKAAPEPSKAEVTTGTLRIKSNRRVLVYVDDKAMGYTPQTVEVKPGKYRVLAMMPGQPNTKQARDANVSAAGAAVNVDFSF